MHYLVAFTTASALVLIGWLIHLHLVYWDVIEPFRSLAYILVFVGGGAVFLRMTPLWGALAGWRA